jgi:membrane protein YqaA with SNARE-associated domain
LPSAILVGLAGGAGAAIGEITGYMLGYSGQSIVHRQKIYTKLEGWVKKWGTLTIFLISLVPFVFDLAGIAAGVLRFPLWKFLLACWLGRTILYIVIAFAGAWGWEVVLRYLG